MDTFGPFFLHGLGNLKTVCKNIGHFKKTDSKILPQKFFVEKKNQDSWTKDTNFNLPHQPHSKNFGISFRI